MKTKEKPQEKYGGKTVQPATFQKSFQRLKSQFKNNPKEYEELAPEIKQKIDKVVEIEVSIRYR